MELCGLDWSGSDREKWRDFLTSHNLIGLYCLLRGIALLYGDGVCFPVRYELGCKYCYK
jgi:hypothetical protein